MAKPGKAVNRVLEQGDVFFFYRPKVGVEMVRALEDLASFHLILHPLDRNLYRYAAVSLKGLLAGDRLRAGWRVKLDAVESNPRNLAKRLREAHPIPAARAAGEGIYAIAEHRRHTHLAYALELPDDPGEVQAALGISKRANPILAVVNPILEALEGPESPQVVLPDYPPELLSKFGERRLIPADPANLLNYEGVELVISETENLDPVALDVELRPDLEDEQTAEIFDVLKLRREDVPMEPLFEGTWV